MKNPTRSLFVLSASLCFLGCAEETQKNTTTNAANAVAESKTNTQATPAVATKSETNEKRAHAGPISFEAQTGWERVEPNNLMRKAQYRLAKLEEDSEDGEIIAFYFGENQGGSSAANLDRWIGLVKQPDGTPSKDVADTKSWEQNGLKITRVDVTGNYVSDSMNRKGPVSYDKKNFRMIAAIVETAKGSVFFKAVGPAKTMAKWAASVESMLKTVQQ